jgi:hypothetical protein
MTPILVDYNVEGQAALLFDMLQAQGWADLLDIHFVSLVEAGLPVTSTDREVWRHAHAHGMLLLTANRTMTGPDSLERTIREVSTGTSWPVLTMSIPERLEERVYREECADRIAEIVMDLEQCTGAGRLYIP